MARRGGGGHPLSAHDFDCHLRFLASLCVYDVALSGSFKCRAKILNSTLRARTSFYSIDSFFVADKLMFYGFRFSVEP